jgi:hypothetical protein
MKAVRIYEYGGPETLKYETDVPEPMLGADMVSKSSMPTSRNSCFCTVL